MHSLVRTSRRVFSGALALGLLASIVLVAAPASASTRQDLPSGYGIAGVPDPLYPHHMVYYDTAGGKWKDFLSAGAENDAIALRAERALSTSAQAVPSSFFQRQVAAVKAAGGGNAQVAKVIEQGNLTRYSRTAVLVAEKTIPATVEGAAAAAKLAPRIPAFPLGALAKGAGTAGLVIGAYQIGAATGAEGLKIFGIDAKGAVCQATGGGDLGGMFISALAGQDCTAFIQKADYIRNADAALQESHPSTCVVGGACYQYMGLAFDSASGQNLACVKETGSPSGAELRGQYPPDPGYDNVTSAMYVNGVCVALTGTGTRQGLYAGRVPVGKTMTYFYVKTQAQINLGGGWNSTSVRVPIVQTAGDPERKLKTTIHGSDNKDYSALSAPYHESSVNLPAPAVPILPPGVAPLSMKVEDSGGTAVNTLYNKDTTPEFKDLLTKYPECVNSSCLLDLRTKGASCFAGNSDCADWFVDLTKETDYSCTYGTHAMPLAECNIYAETFKDKAQAEGATWADPETGLPLGAATTTPGAKALADKTVADASQPRTCFPTGWAALNPVNWVLQPVQCALEWAFVPRETVTRDNDIRLRGAAGGGVLGSIAAVGGSLVAFPVVADGCGGVPWRFKIYTLDINANLLNSCPGQPLHDISVQVKTIVTAILWTIAILAWIRYIATIFGYTGFGSGTPADTTAGGPIDTGGGGVHLFPAYHTDQRAIGGGSQRAIGGSPQKEIGQ